MNYPWCAHLYWDWKPCSEKMVITRENQDGPLPERCPYLINVINYD